MAEQIKINCSISFDDEWIQEDCHWTYDRIFTLTWKIFSGELTDQLGNKIEGDFISNLNPAGFYYRIIKHNKSLPAELSSAESFADYVTKNPNAYTFIPLDKLATKTATSKYNSTYNRKLFTYTYDIRLSDQNDSVLVNRSDEGWITVLAVVKATSYAGKTYLKYASFDYLLELPPVLLEPQAPLKNIRTELVTYNPGEVILSWDKAIELDNSDAANSPDDLDGYCIELFHRPNGAAIFTKVKGLTVLKGETEPEAGVKIPVYKLTRISNYSNDTFTELPEDEEELEEFLQNDLSFKHPAANANDTNEPLVVEAYMELSKAATDGVDLTEPKIYFTPKELNIMPGDSYKFIVYPYSHYEGSLLSTNGLVYTEGTSKGVVRVKGANGKWVEGQVWVCVSAPAEPNKIKWIQAEAIYVKTADSWQESI